MFFNELIKKEDLPRKYRRNEHTTRKEHAKMSHEQESFN